MFADILWFHNQINAAGLNGRTGHAVVLGTIVVLRDGDAPGLMYGLQSVGAIAAGALQDNTHRVLTIAFGQAHQKAVH